MRPRSDFLRLLFAVLAILFLGLLVYAGLGWAVWSEQKWLVETLDRDVYRRLYFAYARAFGGLISRDIDGDGLSDGFEVFFRTDPRNPADLPGLTIWEHRPFKMEVDGLRGLGLPVPEMEGVEWFQMQPGERRRIRCQVFASYWFPEVVHEKLTFAPGMQLQLLPNPPALVALPDGIPSRIPLLVPVTSDGSMEFDLVISADAVAIPSWSLQSVRVSYPISSAPIDPSILYMLASKQSPQPCAVETIPAGDPMHQQAKLSSRQHLVRLRWSPAEPPGDGDWMIEATRDPLEKAWYMIGMCEASATSAHLAYELDDSDPRQRGPMKFRVVAMRGGL